MNTCSIKGCSNPVFGGGVCKYHQYTRHMKGGDLFKRAKKKPVEPRSPAKGTPIPKESKKRKEEHKYYKEVKQEIRQELEAIKAYNCFFCGQPMGTEFGFHHLMGRDGTWYLDKKYMVPAHNDCHVFKYHSFTVEQLLKEAWYSDFLSRLKSLDPKLWEKEMKKQYKAGLFDDDN